MGAGSVRRSQHARTARRYYRGNVRQIFWALASWCARTGGRRPFSEGASVPVCSWLRTNWRAPPRFFLVERNSFRFSRLLADLHDLTSAKIWVAGGGAGGDAPDALASALGLPYGQPQPPKHPCPS